MWRSFYYTPIAYWFTTLFLCDRDMRVFNRFRQLLCNWIKMKFYEKVIDICNYVKEKTPSQAFSCKFCKFLHNNGFWDFLRIILQIFGWLLLDLLLLNVLYYWTAYCERDKIINLTILKVYPAELTRTFFVMKSRFILCDYGPA